MTVKELYSYLDKKIPTSLSCEWDNDGLMCCPEPDREVKRVLVALDVTAEITETAVSGGYDLIVSHHPFIFKGLKGINGEDHISAKAIRLIKEGIGVFSFHTRLDAVEGGVNDVLASKLGLSDVHAFGDEAIGRIGTLEADTDVCSFAAKVRDTLGCEGVFVADGHRPCRRVAVLGGGGEDDLFSAIAAGADTYVSGELKYHSMTDAPDMGINLIEAGHFHTEAPVCDVLAGMIRKACDGVICDVYNSNRIRLI